MKLTAEKRTPGRSRELRGEGRLPAVVYNQELNVPITIELKAFDQVFRSQGLSSIIDLDLDGENHEVLVKAVQMDKRYRVPLHVDFYAVTAGQLVDVHVPVDYVGKAAGAKEGGQLDIQRREIHISVIPRLIPSSIEVDISALEIGDSIHIGDVLGSLPSEAEVLDDAELTLITVVAPRKIEEVEVEVEDELEPEVIGRGEDGDEGEAEAEDDED